MDDDVDEDNDDEDVITVVSPHLIPDEEPLEVEPVSSIQKSSLFKIAINGMN